MDKNHVGRNSNECLKKYDSIRKSLYVGTDQKLQHEKFKGPIIARSDALS